MDPCSEQRDEKDHQLAESAAPGGTLVAPGVKREGQGSEGTGQVEGREEKQTGRRRQRSREELESG